MNQSHISEPPWRTLPRATGRSAFGKRLQDEALGRVSVIVADRDIRTLKGKRTEVVAKSQSSIYGFLMRETEDAIHLGVSASSRPDMIWENGGTEWPAGSAQFLWFVIEIKKSRIVEITRLGK